ncbi:HEAT repeat domain-containing protein [Chryseobacterium sp. ISL-6]|uniref:HEAT repeat domain-containing protein n=1 Tax=Chryseobacterium sp. ISL-6 TaxID=2819143 RepID=UPI001BE6A0BB|nr:HEAT repeat domain-containing protein [Chryseobacterium sp. ISL-6]MBT2620081.1 HEAT repeat domain-containing protein [Chryseobacterium sp. ISL-6]
MITFMGRKVKTLYDFEKLDDNEDLEFQADIIFLLGKLNKKYKSKILVYARQFTQSNNDYKRDRAIIVLGWIGKGTDTNILENHLLNDTNSNCRAWSASAYMQMWFRKENDFLKTKAFEAYKSALPNESDYFVLSVIFSALREMDILDLEYLKLLWVSWTLKN